MELNIPAIVLAASIARTGTLTSASLAFLEAKTASSLVLMKYLIEGGPNFAVTADYRTLADAAQTAFSGELGAAIADIYMTKLGFAWRANAQSAFPRSKKHADFIYGGGPCGVDEVVLTEAHGSFSLSVTSSYLARKATNKYNDQIVSHLGTSTRYGKIIHGYSTAFGAGSAIANGSIVRITETEYPGPLPPSQSPFAQSLQEGEETVQVRLVLSAHRSNFLLMGAHSIVSAIDRALVGADEDSISTSLISFEYAGRRFVAAQPRLQDRLLAPWYWDLPKRPIWHSLDGLSGAGTFGFFAMEERAAKIFLEHLSQMTRSRRASRPARIAMPRLPFIIGDGTFPADVRRETDYVMFRDGLALIRPELPLEAIARLRWSPREGLVSR